MKHKVQFKQNDFVKEREITICEKGDNEINSPCNTFKGTEKNLMIKDHTKPSIKPPASISFLPQHQMSPHGQLLQTQHYLAEITGNLKQWHVEFQLIVLITRMLNSWHCC